MFSSVISLGFYCGVASSISKHGFRSFSGPFDWENSEYEGVLHFIDDDFSDFLLPENLEVDNSSPEKFFDKKYNIRFPHDIHTSFAEDLPSIKAKYKRRIERFIDEEHKGTCFIRAINDPAEIDFIAENREKINSTLTKYNPNNKVIYLIPHFMQIHSDFTDCYYLLDLNFYSLYHEGNRILFDSLENSMVKYLIDNYSVDRRKDNLIFDLQKELNYTKKINSSHDTELRAINDIDKVYGQMNCLNKMIGLDFSKLKYARHTIIYGSEILGKALYDQIKNFTHVECFIDKDPATSNYHLIPIYNLTQYNSFRSDTQIIVTLLFAYPFICRDLVDICHVPKENIISIYDFLNLEK